MSETFWDEVEAIFAAALECPIAERAALLDARCHDRDDLRREVDSLLAANARSQGFLHHPTVSADNTSRLALREGEHIGPFRLVERIASGGMGTVYRAERDDGSFDQRVAIKVIAAPMTRESAQRRFRSERQILASLQHPHIVTLVDGGVTPGGEAYLIMEYVDGVPITEYCRARDLGVRARLQLFRQICDAVHYAHSHFVIHRDLKPANVLVTQDGVPKVLDFGVAKLVERDPTARPELMTEPGFGPMTPNYASPEQLRGLPVTTASDVYALGVLFYELLTGARPYETAGKPFDDVMRLVVETDATRPSEATPAADVRPSYDSRRVLRGDLDAIALRALNKAPEKRYASADALSVDIGRYVNGVPIEAREPSFAYLVRKLAARHRIAFISIAASAALVVVASGVAIWQARSATLARQRADRRFADVRAIAHSLIFDVNDALEPVSGTTTARRMIVSEGLKYLERLTPDSGGDPDLQLELGRAYIRIGSVQGRPNTANLGDRTGAIESFKKARQLLEPLAHQPHASATVFGNYIDAIRFMGETVAARDGIVSQGSRESANDVIREATAFVERHPKEEDALNILAAAEFRMATVARPPQSLPYWLKARELYGELLALKPDNVVRQRNVALVEKYLGAYYESMRDYDAAFGHHQRAFELDQRRYEIAPNDRMVQFDVSVDLSNLGYAHLIRQEYAEAQKFYERCLAMREQMLASDPKDTLARSKVAFTLRQLGATFLGQRRYEDALQLFTRSIAEYQIVGLNSAEARQTTAFSWSRIGEIKKATGDKAGSCRAFGTAFGMYATFGESERRIDSDGFDRLPELAKKAAACNIAEAGAWVREHQKSLVESR